MAFRVVGPWGGANICRTARVGWATVLGGFGQAGVMGCSGQQVGCKCAWHYTSLSGLPDRTEAMINPFSNHMIGPNA